MTFVTLLCAQWILVACSPIKVPVSNQYKLESFSRQKLTTHNTPYSILISKPEAMAGYQTEQMLYVKKPFELRVFANNAWVSSPANMLYPLMTQSLQKTGYFYAVASGPYLDKADYRLDSQLIDLRQNFLTKPSTIELTVKVMLTHVEDNRVVTSHTFHERVRCPMDTPYGGVIAANQAMCAFTAKLSKFIVRHVNQDHGEKYKTIVQ